MSSAPVSLRIEVQDPSRPQLVGVDLIPSRGMNLYQIYAHMPARGIVPLLIAPALESGDIPNDPSSDNPQGNYKKSDEDPYGNLSFKYGGAFLIPFANRIRGKLSGDSIHTSIAGHEVHLPANWSSGKPGAERIAMHGLILKSVFQVTQLKREKTRAQVSATFDAQDFEGHWPSLTQLDFELDLTPEKLHFSITAKNVGKETLPMAMGWHPYFAILSGDRAQAQLCIPARQRLLVNNYDDVFATGARETVADTKYDFRDGRALGNLYLDDCFTDLDRTSGPAQLELKDPKSSCSLQITASSPEISAFQIYAPLDQNFVAIEPQFNLADPAHTGMIVLAPGASTQYSLQLKWGTHA